MGFEDLLWRDGVEARDIRYQRSDIRRREKKEFTTEVAEVRRGRGEEEESAGAGGEPESTD